MFGRCLATVLATVHDSDSTITIHYNYHTVVDGTSDEILVGSLDYDSSIIDEDRTYILAGYTVPCNGTVVAWEFCYQISGITSATLYPGIWRITDKESDGDTDYELIQSSVITFNSSGTSANARPCQNFTLSGREQFIAPSGAVIGLYSNKKEERSLLLRTDDMDDSVTTFRFRGNRSSVNDARLNTNEDVDYNIAIRVHLSK